jgi:diadenosine tetraphosphate (Ap4A) HIT family hydrolase
MSKVAELPQLANACVLCHQAGGQVLVQQATYRIVAADDATVRDYPGTLRVIASAHAKEMSDLAQPLALALMQAVLLCERVVRTHMRCDKINLASLGNQVAHVHWHVIPRYIDDAHFPLPIWAARQRDIEPERFAERSRRAATLGESLERAFGALVSLGPA